MTTEPTPTPPAPQRPGTAPNPFVGIPMSDYARDAVALILLLVSLALPWSFGGAAGTRGATDHIGVVLATVLSLLSLALTYLARAQVFGTAMSVGRAALVRGAANVPYALVVAVYLIVDASTGSDEWFRSGGVGTAAAVGLAGATVAGMPRESETESLSRWQVSTMRRGAVGLAALWTVLSFLNVILVLVGYRDYAGTDLARITIAVLIVFGVLAAATWGLYVRNAAARVAILAGTLAVLATTVVDWWTGWDLSGFGVESLHLPAFAVLPLLTLGAMVSSPLVRSGMKRMPASQRDSGAAVWLMVAIASIAGATIVMTILGLAGDAFASTGVAIGYIVTLVLIATAVLVAAAFVRQNFAGSRLLAIAVVGGTLLVGVVSLVLVDTLSSIGSLDVTLHVGLPLAVIALLTLSMRGAPVHSSGQAVAPETPPHPRADEAADPSTSAHALHQIATTIPELRPTVAANPSAYPELLEWMGQLGEPDVDAALAQRDA